MINVIIDTQVLFSFPLSLGIEMPAHLSLLFLARLALPNGVWKKVTFNFRVKWGKIQCLILQSLFLKKVVCPGWCSHRTLVAPPVWVPEWLHLAELPDIYIVLDVYSEQEITLPLCYDPGIWGLICYHSIIYLLLTKTERLQKVEKCRKWQK